MFGGEHRFCQITHKKTHTHTHSPEGFNTVRFHELTLIDSGLPLSSWRQFITSAACVECNTAEVRQPAYLLLLVLLLSPPHVIACLKDRLYGPPLNAQNTPLSCIITSCKWTEMLPSTEEQTGRACSLFLSCSLLFNQWGWLDLLC